jgi:hypothetical protein
LWTLPTPAAKRQRRRLARHRELGTVSQSESPPAIQFRIDHGAPDEVKAAPTALVEHEAGQTVGMASLNRSKAAAQNSPLPAIERKGMPILRLLDAPSMVLVTMAVVALGLDKFLSRRAYAKKGLAFGTRGFQQPPDHERPPSLSWQPPNEIEADPAAASILNSVKKTLDMIAEAQAEMASSRQFRTPL